MYKKEYQNTQKLFYIFVGLTLLSIGLLFVSYYFIFLTLLFVTIAYLLMRRFYKLGVKIPTENIPKIKVKNGKLMFEKPIKYREAYMVIVDSDVPKSDFEKFKNLYPRNLVRVIEKVYSEGRTNDAILASTDPYVFIWSKSDKCYEGNLIDLTSFNYTLVNKRDTFIYFGKVVLVEVEDEYFIIMPVIRKRFIYIENNNIRVYNNGELQYEFSNVDKNCITLKPYIPDIFNERPLNVEIKKCTHSKTLNTTLVPKNDIIIIFNLEEFVDNYRIMVSQLPKNVMYTTVGIYVNNNLVKLFEPDFNVILYNNFVAIVPKIEAFKMDVS